MGIVESIVLGVAQGIAEWLPISSEGVLVLLMTRVFGHHDALSVLIGSAVFLHLGTVCAAVWYYRHTLWRLLRVVMVRGERTQGDVSLMWFLIISTAITGLVGGALLFFLSSWLDATPLSFGGIMIAIGVLLIVTGGLQIAGMRMRLGYKRMKDVGIVDACVAGCAQGFAILPGLSRSGLTISALLLRGVHDDDALAFSFLMSIPAVLGANVVFGLSGVVVSVGSVIAFVSSFVVGLLTIRGLLVAAKRIPFGWFVVAFGVLTIIAGLL